MAISFVGNKISGTAPSGKHYDLAVTAERYVKANKEVVMTLERERRKRDRRKR